MGGHVLDALASQPDLSVLGPQAIDVLLSCARRHQRPDYSARSAIRSLRHTRMWPMSAAVTRTAGSHTNGGYATKVFSRSSPNQRNRGVDTMATATMFTSSARPTTFQAATTHRGTRPRASHQPSRPAVRPAAV